MDYLRLLLQRDGLLRRRRDAARDRGAPARPVPARDPPRAQPDHVPPRVARHERARPRRDLDVLVLLPRARDDPRPVRDVLRAADAHPLLPGRRRDRGHPRRASARSCASSSRDARRASTSTRDLLEKNEIVLAAAARYLARSTSRRCSSLGVTGAAAARRGRPMGPAQGGAVLAATTTSTSRSRSARSATTTTASASAWPRSTSRSRSSSRRSTGCPRAPTSPPTARSRCRRATSSRPRWRR